MNFIWTWCRKLGMDMVSRQYEWGYVLSNGPLERNERYMYHICMVFLRCEFANGSSSLLVDWIERHKLGICMVCCLKTNNFQFKRTMLATKDVTNMEMSTTILWLNLTIFFLFSFWWFWWMRVVVMMVATVVTVSVIVFSISLHFDSSWLFVACRLLPRTFNFLFHFILKSKCIICLNVLKKEN